VFEEAADVVLALAEAHDIPCEAHIASGLTVWGNAVRLRQVVLNLGENAVQFTPAGGQMRIQATNVDHQVVLKVEDTGSGIAPEALTRVFERRYKAGGPGAIVKRVVDAHGGSVRIESTLGEGTQVTVTLPASPPS
jgi:signal transduction histidine kinase